ncbi:hypothetical protein BJY04DRAFT_50431 [Aspergillus karnatakaensis]|uniref:uncharacterized protein n=1 Tax=Aspergillus karnatakaensis TaxID=1810916 RepID=UPI003CCDDB71
MKAPTDEFPFDHFTVRQPERIQRSKDIHIEVGRSSSRSPSLDIDPPASDVVRIRVFRRGGTTTPKCYGGIMTEKVQFRSGDIVVRNDTNAKILRFNDVESNPNEGFAEETSAW